MLLLGKLENRGTWSLNLLQQGQEAANSVHMWRHPESECVPNGWEASVLVSVYRKVI